MTLRFPLLLLACAAVAAQAQPQVPLTAPFAAPGTTAYDPAVPTPDEVLGYRIGERHTRPDEVVRYFEAVAAASPRVTLGEHGRTYEGRRLLHAIVTAPRRDVEAAREANVRLSEDPAAVADAEVERLPVVAYMGYSVHGNEASGTEAALLLLYHLAAGRGPAVEAALADAVVLIDPMLNPDGRDRFVDWANRNRGGTPTADRQDREHREAWPGGRTNHYLFDLNRDWLPVQLRESEGRMALWHRWRPQLSTDFHEMGSDATYFFQPGIPSRDNPNTPAATFDLTGRIAEHHARALDRIGQLYYSGESFDDFYYGKGSTYPDVNGAVGILFEQASSRALVSDTDHGRLDYGTTVRNQLATSLSSLEAAVAMRADLLRHQRDFYRGAPEVAGAAPVQAWVVGTDRYPVRAAALAELLARHRIRIHRLARPVEAGGERFAPGAAYVVPVDQPQARLVKAALERVTAFGDSLFYDVSTWTLPLAFGVRYGEVTEAEGLVGAALEPERPAGRLVGGRAAYAYLVPWGTYYAPRALHRLQQGGVRVHLATDPLTADVAGERKAFARGTLVVPVQQAGVDAEAVHQLVDEAVRLDHVEAFALASGLTPAGPNLGSPSVEVLERPRVALLAGEGTHAYSVGEAWYLLSERMEVPVSLLDADALPEADLDRYTTLVLAGPVRGLDSVAVGAVRDWVAQGGTLVATEGAVGWAAEHGLAELERREAEPDSTLLAELDYADLDAARGAQVVGGAVFEAALDPTHPVAFGHPDRVALFKPDASAFEPSTTPGTAVAVLTAAPLLSGYASDENVERLAGAGALAAQRHGRGRVVLLDFDPTFRAFWWGTHGLFLNAVFFGGAF